MDRYILFGFLDYESNGGWNDVVKKEGEVLVFDNILKAISYSHRLYSCSEMCERGEEFNIQIVNLQILKVMIRLRYDSRM